VARLNVGAVREPPPQIATRRGKTTLWCSGEGPASVEDPPWRAGPKERGRAEARPSQRRTGGCRLTERRPQAYHVIGLDNRR